MQRIVYKQPNYFYRGQGCEKAEGKIRQASIVLHFRFCLIDPALHLVYCKVFSVDEKLGSESFADIYLINEG